MNYRRHINSVVLVGIANVFVYARNMFLLPILTRSLGINLYGLWSQLYALIELLTPLFLLRLPSAFTRFLAAEQEVEAIRSGFWTSFLGAFLSSTLLSLTLLLMSVPVRHSFGAELRQIADMLWVVTLLIMLSSASNSCINYFRTFEKSVLFSGMILVESIGFLFITLGVSLMGGDIMSPIIGLVSVKIIICLWGLPKIFREIGFCKIDWKTLKIYLSYSLPLVPMGILYWTIQMSDRYLIDLFLSKKEVGRYAATYTLGGLISFVYGPIFAFLMPAATKLWENNQLDDLRQFFLRSLKYPSIIAIPIAFTSPVWGLTTIKLVAGTNYVTSKILILVVLIGYLALMIGTFFATILHLTKKNATLLWINILTAGVNIGLNLVFIPVYGIEGAGLSTAITFLIQTTVFYLFSRRYFTFDLGIKNLVKIIIASLLCTLLMSFWGIHNLETLITCIILGTSVYIALLWISHAITRQEMTFAWRFFKERLLFLFT
ncbi:MAG: polysaccharide biosynthesis C-terminal domain-containing protein [Candidatus Latescibacterota bacterium]|nr:polysaccharide biosynthesis C-terminal domain-containing protein [Candidatus Latescibacterota bacterium]